MEGLKPKGPGNERTVLVGAESGLSVLWGASVRVPGTSYRREVKLPFPVAPGGGGRFCFLDLGRFEVAVLHLEAEFSFHITLGTQTHP